MRRAYVGLSLALALFIIAQGVSRPEFFYALVIPIVVLLYGVLAKETLPEVIKDDEEETAGRNDD
jgi:hypothetical protein